MARLVTALMVVGTVLAGAIGAELTGGVANHDAPSVAPTAARPIQPAKPIIAQPPRAALADAILSRPLFSPTRRPAAQAKTATARPALAMPRLSGIIMSGEQRSAIFAAADEGRRSVVAGLGEHVGEYVVQAIESERVTLVGPGGKRVLQPSFDPNPRRTERPPPSAAAAPAALPFAAPSAVMPSLRNLAGFGGPPVLEQAGPDRLSRLGSLRRVLAPRSAAVR